MASAIGGSCRHLLHPLDSEEGLAGGSVTIRRLVCRRDSGLLIECKLFGIEVKVEPNALFGASTKLVVELICR